MAESDVVGILNIPGKGSVRLIYLGDRTFSTDVPGTAPIPLERVKQADQRGLIAWHRPMFLSDLEGGLAGEGIPVADSPLAGVDVASIGEDGGGTPAVRDSQPPVSEPQMIGDGIQSASLPVGAKAKRGLKGIFGDGENTTKMQKGIFTAIIGIAILAVAGTLLWQSVRVIGSSDGGNGYRSAASDAEPADEDTKAAAEDAMRDVQDAVAAGDEAAFSVLVDIDAVAFQMAAAYAAEAREAQGLTDAEASSLEASYAKVFRAREIAAVQAKDAAGSFFAGDIAGPRIGETGPSVLVRGGSLPFERAFLMSPEDSYRIVGLANAAEMAGWMAQ